jgi:hypothetical protein
MACNRFLSVNGANNCPSENRFIANLTGIFGDISRHRVEIRDVGDAVFVSTEGYLYIYQFGSHQSLHIILLN